MMTNTNIIAFITSFLIHIFVKLMPPRYSHKYPKVGVTQRCVPYCDLVIGHLILLTLLLTNTLFVNETPN